MTEKKHNQVHTRIMIFTHTNTLTHSHTHTHTHTLHWHTHTRRNLSLSRVGKGGGEKGDMLMLCYICCLLLSVYGWRPHFPSGIKNFLTWLDSLSKSFCARPCSHPLPHYILSAHFYIPMYVVYTCVTPLHPNMAGCKKHLYASTTLRNKLRILSYSFSLSLPPPSPPPSPSTAHMKLFLTFLVHGDMVHTLWMNEKA